MKRNQIGHQVFVPFLTVTIACIFMVPSIQFQPPKTGLAEFLPDRLPPPVITQGSGVR